MFSNVVIEGSVSRLNILIKVDCASPDSYVGGLVGFVDEYCEIAKSHSGGTVRSKYLFDQYTQYIGGLIGYNRRSSVVECSSACEVTTTSYPDKKTIESYIGGLIGFNYGDVSFSYATGSISLQTLIRGGIGGLVGKSSGTINNCYAQGNVVAKGDTSGFFGGFVGDNSGQIVNCYASGNVSCVYKQPIGIGGFAGNHEGEIKNCLAYGDVALGTNVSYYYNADAFCPDNSNINNCYRAEYQKISGEGIGFAVGTAVLESELNTVDFYTEKLQWNFDLDYSQLDVVNGKYPVFKQ